MSASELRVAGVAAVFASLEARPDDALRLFLAEAQAPRFGEVMREFAARKLPYRVVGPEELARIAKTERHEGVVLVTRPIPEHDLSYLDHDGPSVVVAAPGIENPHNLGALMRVGAHFGIDALLLEESDPRLSAAACRVAEGGAEHVAVVRVPQFALARSRLRDLGYGVFATSSHGDAVSLFDARLPRRLVWLVGSESRGLPPNLLQASDACVTIPGTGQVESLNLATATGILLAETLRRQHTRG